MYVCVFSDSRTIEGVLFRSGAPNSKVVLTKQEHKRASRNSTTVVQSARDDMLKHILQMHPHSQALQIMNSGKKLEKDAVGSEFYEQQILTADERERYRSRYMNLPERDDVKQSLLKLKKLARQLEIADTNTKPASDTAFEQFTRSAPAKRPPGGPGGNLTTKQESNNEPSLPVSGLFTSSDDSMPTYPALPNFGRPSVESRKASTGSPLPGVKGDREDRRTKWAKDLEETKWLSGIEFLLAGTSKVVALVQMGEPVIVQNPDGIVASPLCLYYWCCVHFQAREGLCISDSVFNTNLLGSLLPHPSWLHGPNRKGVDAFWYKKKKKKGVFS